MKIAQLAPLWLPIPPMGFGGTERVIDGINKGLAALGHEITLFACAGSSCDGKTIEIIDKPMYDLLGKFDFSAVQSYEFLSFAELIKRKGEFDVIHNHMGIHPLALAEAIDVPIVTTYHSSIEPDFPYLAEAFKANRFVSISYAQRSLAPDFNWIATVPNPIDASMYTPSFSTGNDYLLFIGALNENKGVHIAIEAAKRLNMKLILAGKIMYEKDQQYFNEVIKPQIDNIQIQFIGEVNDEQKNELYRDAKAFLFPSQWHEAFGLVAIEAMACGTPVVAFDKGAMREIINDGETGFIAVDLADYIEKVKRVHEISRENCRQHVIDNFDYHVVAKRYEQVFIDSISK